MIDRLSWWYQLPREWLKKIALMDDVYLLNNPFTFQAMEKHSAYCAMLRLGFRIPATWLIPHKDPPGGGKWEQAEAKFEQVASRYNAPFDLEQIAGRDRLPAVHEAVRRRAVGRRDADRRSGRAARALRRVGPPPDAPPGRGRADSTCSCAASPSAPETMVMRYDPDKPLHDRYQIAHDFLTPELGHEIVTFSRLVNAFFRWEFNSSETIVKDGVMHPIDYANASPDVALTSLHYYFPWAIVGARALVGVLRREPAPHAHQPEHAHVLRDRRP